MNQEHTLKLLESEKAKKLLGELYGKAAVAENQKRYEDLVGKFVKEFGEKDLYSVLQDGPRSAATIPITTMERY